MDSTLTYQALRRTLRPPRVAIVFDGSEEWRSWAALAMFTAGRAWGGVGFVLVPHVAADVHPALLRMTAHYDPDYVVSLACSLVEYEAIHPGLIRINGLDGQPVIEPAARADLLTKAHSGRMPLPDLRGPRQLVADACTPYVQRRERADLQDHEHIEVLGHDSIGSPLTGVPPGPDSPGSTAGAPAGADPDFFLACALRYGVASLPRLPLSSSAAVLPGPVIELLDSRLNPHSYGYPAWLYPPDSGEARVAAVRSAWEVTNTGLVHIAPWMTDRAPTLIVVGSSSNDFALAYLWDRMYGRARWIPDSWLHPEAPLRPATMGALGSIISNHAFSQKSVLLTSTSIPAADLQATVEELVQHKFIDFVDESNRDRDAKLRATVGYRAPEDLPLEPPRKLACDGEYDVSFAAPARQDHLDTVTLVTPFPPVLPDSADLSSIPNLHWEVDVTFDGAPMPRGRGVAGAPLLDPAGAPGNRYDSWVRSGRDGPCFWSHSWGFVPAGANAAQSAARPVLRCLGLQEWVGVRLPEGTTAAASEAGVRAALGARLWGGRAAFAADVDSPLRLWFREFLTTAKSSSQAYPAGDGVLLGRDGLLSLTAARRVLGEHLDATAVRERLDGLLASGAMRRGLILGCSECRQTAFVPVDDLRQRNTCTRCGTLTQLTQPAWRDPADCEPVWFYDLHPALRELMRDNGHVPLLASNYLRRATRSRYDDLGELHIRRDSKTLFEVDLIATAEDTVIVGEAKINAKLDGSAADRKTAATRLADLALWLRADEVALFTTEVVGTWAEGDIAVLRSVLGARTWPSGVAPRIRVITGLGTTSITNSDLG